MADMNRNRPDLADLAIDPQARADVAPHRRAIWIAAAATAALLLAAAFLLLRRGAVEVETAAARPATGAQAAAVLNASGYVTPRRRATVAAKVTGRVKEMLVEEGMTVERDQVLARLDDRDARAAMDAAQSDREAAAASLPGLQANLHEAELTLERTAELRRSGYVDQQSLDRARAGRDSLRAQLEVARRQAAAAAARLELARRDLDNCVVRAPFAGVAVSKDAQPGEIVSPVSAGGGFTRTGISTIVDMTSLEIEVDVNEAAIAKVLPGQAVEATLNAYPDWTIPCSVRTVIPTADRQKATVKVRIAFAALDPRILPDMGVKVAFLAPAAPAGTVPARALAPRAALRSENGQTVVYLLRGDRLERRVVRGGETRGDDVEILAGVEPGDALVVAGPAGLHDGQAARARR